MSTSASRRDLCCSSFRLFASTPKNPQAHSCKAEYCNSAKCRANYTKPSPFAPACLELRFKSLEDNKKTQHTVNSRL